MNYSFINDYNAIPLYIAPSYTLGIGTYRIYINADSAAVSAQAHGIGRILSINFLTQSVISQIADAEVAYDESCLCSLGNSVDSQYLLNTTQSAGKTLFGNYDNIKLSSGLAIIYGINGIEPVIRPTITHYAVDADGNSYVDSTGYEYILR